MNYSNLRKKLTGTNYAEQVNSIINETIQLKEHYLNMHPRLKNGNQIQSEIKRVNESSENNNIESPKDLKLDHITSWHITRNEISQTSFENWKFSV
jgi:hypothetical protein